MKKLLVGAVFAIVFTVFLGKANIVQAVDPISTPTPVLGCTDPSAINYNPLATEENGTCNFCPNGQVYNRSTSQCEEPASNPVLGCTDPSAINYNPAATQDDHTCNFCPEGQVYNRDTLACEPAASNPVLGCTDPSATNYDPAATQDDHTCNYPSVPEFGIIPGAIALLTSGGAFLFLKKRALKS